MLRSVHFQVPMREVSSRFPQYIGKMLKRAPKEEAKLAKQTWAWMVEARDRHPKAEDLALAAMVQAYTVPQAKRDAWLADKASWVHAMAKRAIRIGEPKPGPAWVVPLQHGVFGASAIMISQMREAQRSAAFGALASAFGQGPLPSAALPGRLRVTLTRVSMGRLDAHDAVAGAFKYVADAVAFWAQRGLATCSLPNWTRLLGHGDEKIDWAYAQDPAPRGYNGITITIEDDLPGEPIIVGAPPGRPPTAAERRKAAKTMPTVLVPGWVSTVAAPTPVEPSRIAVVALPWEQDADDPDALITGSERDAKPVCHEARAIARAGYPAVFPVRAPDTAPTPGRRYLLVRKPYQDDDLGGKVWLYEAPAPPPEEPRVIRRATKKK